MMSLFNLALVAGTLLPPVNPAGAAPDLVTLRDRSQRDFDLSLPAMAWRPVAGKIPVVHAGGEGFLAKPQGLGLSIDTDGDGKADRLVEGSVDPATQVRKAWVRLTGQRAGGEKLEYAVRLQDEGKGWQWAPSGYVQGMAGKTKVRIVDLDGDGRFDGYGTDAMVLGSGSIAGFLSKVMHVDGELVSIDVAADGSQIALEAFTGPTGTIDAKSSLETDGKLLAALVRSENGQMCFDLARARGPLSLPVGSYRIHSGALGLGDARLMVGPGRTSALELAQDQALVLDWGGPAKAEFAYKRSGSEVAFSPDQVWYYGNAGEEYFGWDPIGKSPEFTITEAKLGTELEKALFPGTC